MKIYEIDQAIEDLIANSVDPDTGELMIDFRELDDLQMERERKIENLGLYIKNVTAEAKAIGEEERSLASRRRALEAAGDRARAYLEFVLHGEKFTTPRLAVSYRTSQSVELDNDFLEWAMQNDQYLRYKLPEPDKIQIKEDLKNGMEIPHAKFVTNKTMTIK